jgi:peptidoglycan/xylan/chitin deacetylase (PgdA/CDA1 family)
MSKCYIVMYHYVRDTAATPYPDIKALHPADFERQLDWLQANFDVLTYPQFEAMLRGELRFERSTALLTFDDGFVDNYEIVYPIFQRRGLSGVFFITTSTQAERPALLNVHKTHFLLAKMGATAFTDAVERELKRELETDTVAFPDQRGLYRYDTGDNRDVKRLLNYELPFDLTDRVLSRLFAEVIGADETEFARSLYIGREQISAMAAGGMTFGGHTRTHRVLSRLSADEQYHDLADGVTLVRELTGQTSIPFCYPYGHAQTYNQATIAHLSALGYATAFNTVRQPLDPAAYERYALPRYDTRDLPPFAAHFGA